MFLLPPFELFSLEPVIDFYLHSELESDVDLTTDETESMIIRVLWEHKAAAKVRKQG